MTRSRRPKGEERTREPVPLQDILGGLSRERSLAGGLAVGRLAMRWPSVVGERLAPETAPAELEGGTLVVAVSSGPWGAQAKFLAEEIRKRANETLGRELIAKVQIVVRENPRNPL